MFDDLFDTQHPIAQNHTQSVVTSPKDIDSIVTKCRQQGKTIGWTSGVFDMLHAGHQMFLQHCAQHCDVFIVSLNTDKSVQSHKPVKSGIPRPLISEQLRAMNLLSTKGVDHVIMFDEQSPIKHIHQIKPDFWFRGESYERDYGMKMEEHPEGQAVTGYGGKCQLLPLAGGYSTTELVKRLQQLKA